MDFKIIWLLPYLLIWLDLKCWLTRFLSSFENSVPMSLVNLGFLITNNINF